MHADPDHPPLPAQLQVEVTAACNLRCRMCLVRYRPPVNRVTGSMPMSTFEALLAENPNVTDVTLQGLGEPLLAPDLLAMVHACSERDIAVGFNTNATLLNRRKADALVAAGLDWLCISLDGATRSTYESIRDGATFDKVVRNIGGMVEAKRRAGADRPDLKIVFVAMRRNVHELPDLVRLAAQLGVMRVSVQSLSHSFEDTAGEAGYEEISAFTSGEALWMAGADRVTADVVFAEACAVADALGVDLHLPHLEEREDRRRPGEPGCDWPWRATYVNHDGGVQPCCMVMGAERATLGHVLDDGFRNVWWGEASRSFRTALHTDEPPSVCRGCAMYRGLF